MPSENEIEAFWSRGLKSVLFIGGLTEIPVCPICRTISEYQKCHGEKKIHNSHFKPKLGRPFHLLFRGVYRNHLIVFESHNLRIHDNNKGVHEKESQISSLEIKIFEWFLYEYKQYVYKVESAIIHHGSR